MTQAQLMNSGYARIANDHYPTIDPRCVYGLLQHVQPNVAVDVCAPNGSGIVDTLQECGVRAYGVPDAFAKVIHSHWIVTNVPYKRDKVDSFLWAQIERIHAGDVYGFASLHRWGFDFAASRQDLFKNNFLYHGQVKLLFRPRWIAKRKGQKQPFHPYVWHLWTADHVGLPATLYATGDKL